MCVTGNVPTDVIANRQRACEPSSGGGVRALHAVPAGEVSVHEVLLLEVHHPTGDLPAVVDQLPHRQHLNTRAQSLHQLASNSSILTCIDIFWKCSAQSTHWDASVILIMYVTWFDL